MSNKTFTETYVAIIKVTEKLKSIIKILYTRIDIVFLEWVFLPDSKSKVIKN